MIQHRHCKISHQLLSLMFILFLVPLCKADELKPFATDGCSDFPDGTLDHKTLWLNCCIAHDIAYWLGGTYDERLAADKALETCVADVGEPEIASLMLAGVRVGGSPYWITPYRWGYGWPYWDGLWPRGYRPMNEEEQRQADVLLLDIIRSDTNN